MRVITSTALMKKLCYLIATVSVGPLALAELLLQQITGRPVWYAFHTQMLSVVPGKTGIFLRNAYYHLLLRRCPLSCGFQFGTIINPDAEVGERVSTGVNVVIGMATIGDDVLIAEGVHIVSGKHSHLTRDPSLPFHEQAVSPVRVHVGRNCWIGANAVVMADIGNNCVVGAGAVITRPFPDDKVLLGNPARAIAGTFGSEIDVRQVTQ